MEKILLAQFIAHLIADFFAQPECFSREKQSQLFRSWHIYIHTLIVFVTSLAMTLACGFVMYALAIAIIHFGIDVLKCTTEHWLKKKKGIVEDQYHTNHYLFFTDQILHLIVIYGAVAIYWCREGNIPGYLEYFTVPALLTMAGFFLCMKPANVFIRVCLCSLNLPQTEDDKNNLERAGRWIGTIERLMTMALVLLQQYTAIGFIIAAKSVLRYKDSEAGKTEYVLIGTLLSFCVVLFIGVGIKSGAFEWFLRLISY
jgi:hypothetical protein